VPKLLNQQGRRVTGCLWTTPQDVLMDDAGLRPAEPLLDNLVSQYKLRQLNMPNAIGRGRMIALEGNIVRRVEGIG